MPAEVYRTAIGFLISVVALYAFVAYFIVFRNLQSRSRGMFAVLLGCEIVIVIVHLGWVEDRTTFWSWFVNMDFEMNLGAIFSVTQYTLVVLTAALIATRMPQLNTGQRLYWGVMALVMAWLCIDEFFAIHESISWWRSGYTIGGGLVVLLTTAAFLLWYRDKPGLFIPLIFGLVVMGISGVLLDVLTNDQAYIVAGHEIKFVQLFGCNSSWWPFVKCRYMNKLGFVEEFLEMGGVTAILTTLASQVEEHMERRWSTAIWRGLAVVVVVWMGVAAWRLWFGATLATRSAQPLDVAYLDDRIELVGYTMTPQVAQPGDDITVTVYARLRQPVPTDYILSIHALTRFEGDSIAQADLELGEWNYPTSAWIPDLIVRNRVTFTLPDTLNLPQSYWITATVWQKRNLVTVSHTDRQQVDQDTVVLTDLPVTDSKLPPVPTTSTNITFPADGLILAGYDIPTIAAPGDLINVRFWWKATSNPPGDYQQFVHLIDSVSGVQITQDQSPFGGDRFPTSDWPVGLYESATWQIAIPADAAAGSYRVYTGLYTLPDLVRRSAVDGEGQPVRDNAIPLGTLTIDTP
jgi:hypothetical protein